MGGACSTCSKGGATVSPEERPAEAPRAPDGPTTRPASRLKSRRGSVSAEPAGTGDGLARSLRQGARTSIAKGAQARQRIQDMVRSTVLFKGLDEEQQAGIIDAMFERRVAAGEAVIKEGEEGDNFWVVESGRFEATRGGRAVATYDGRGAFGELALLHNTTRAATVTALTEGVLWGVGRATFRALVVCSMADRQLRHEAWLRSVPVFQHLQQGQLAAVADCLQQERFEPGEHILREGAPLDEGAKFYIVEAGTVDCFRTFEGTKRAVGRLKPGGVFGEVALLTKAPRQADCVAATPVRCLTMSREAFERVMGPVEQVLSQQIAQYAASNAQQQAIKLEPDHGVGQLLPAGGSIPAPEATDGVVGGAPGGTPRPSHSGTAAAQASAVAEPALPLEPGLHAAASGGGVAALLPGSPRPSLLSADSPTGGRRRSTRGAHSSHSSEGEGSSGGGSPSAASALQQRHSGGLVVGTGAALGADAGVAAITATADCASSSTAALLQEQPSAEAVIHLPTIAEEPTEAAPAASPRPRTGGKAVHAARPARAPAGRALPSTATRKPGPGKVSVAARPSGGGAAGGSRASGTKAAPRKSKA